MMRLAHPDVNSVIDFSEGIVNVLVIENPKFFRKTVNAILSPEQGDLV
ncbi:MAG: hypothetical protein HUJ86_01365, partial [Synergistes sp.]|nr:hypothetical protein [Synergistes sp.]